MSSSSGSFSENANAMSPPTRISFRMSSGRLDAAAVAAFLLITLDRTTIERWALSARRRLFDVAFDAMVEVSHYHVRKPPWLKDSCYVVE